MWHGAPDIYKSHRSCAWEEGELERWLLLSRSWAGKEKKAQVFHWGNEGKNTNHILGYKKKHEKGMYRNKERVKPSRVFVPKGNIGLTDFYNWSEHKSFINLTTTKVLKHVLSPPAPDFIRRNTLIVPSGNW